MSTANWLFSFLSGILAQICGQIVSIIRRIKKYKFGIVIYFKMKKISLLIDVRRSKTSSLKLPNSCEEPVMVKASRQFMYFNSRRMRFPLSVSNYLILFYVDSDFV